MTSRLSRKLAAILVMLACLPFGNHAMGDSIVETFDDGSNIGGWTWGAADSIQSTGGNPGWFLRTLGLDTFAPQPRTTVNDSPFTGDYRAAGVSAFDIDLITEHVDFSAEGRPLTLMLLHDNDTPGDPFDDTAAYFMHAQNVPLEGEGWISYHFDIPSANTKLPDGWLLLNMGDLGAPADHSWDDVVQHVSQVRFFYGDPTFFFIFQMWILGMDNVEITTESTTECLDTDDDGQVGTTDLLGLLIAWGTADPTFDFDGDGDVNTVDLLELIVAWGPCPI